MAECKLLPADAKPNRLERLLEVGLEETFPASDAVAVIEPAPRESPQFKAMFGTSSEALGGQKRTRLETAMIRKIKSGGYRLYSRKINPKTGKRRNLGTFTTRAEAEKHERAVQYSNGRK
jgi:hypothetical protein